MYDSLKIKVKAKGFPRFDSCSVHFYHDHAPDFYTRLGRERICLNSMGELLSRWFRHARRFFQMMIGLAFLCLAVAGGLVSFSEWRTYQANQTLGWSHFGAMLAFTIFLIILSLYSFLRARSVR